MNALSALRQVFVSDPQSVVSAATARAPGRIPTAELQALSDPSAAATVASPTRSQESFSGLLSQFVNDVNSRQLMAREQVAALQSGQDVPVHEVMIAMEEASVSFQLMVEVRNKLLESYQELMRMQV